jgi:hypothetical protein
MLVNAILQLFSTGRSGHAISGEFKLPFPEEEE